jgi:hypothetical protein
MFNFRIKTLTAVLSALVAFSSFANDNSCISHKDLSEIANHFDQFDQFISAGSEQYCSADMGEKWFKIAQSLVLLKNISPNEPTVDAADALTLQAITEKDWWAYFLKRARSFSIRTRCQTGVVAYVQPFFGRGNINLCDLFFEQNISSQASTMMHEVRHFDGHRHVTCTQGNEQGTRGACDDEITDRGSYAISVQTLVGFARSKDISETEKPRLEAEAVYMAFNKFNRVPKVKIENSIVLSNEQGEVYSWTPGGELDFIKDLTQPAVIVSNGRNLNVFPTDKNETAYRADSVLGAKLQNFGLYINHYNSESVADRQKYKTISYFGTGGLLKGNELITICNGRTGEFGNVDLSERGEFVGIVSMTNGDASDSQSSFLLGEDGTMIGYRCNSNTSSKVTFVESKLKLDQAQLEVSSIFGMGGKNYALTKSGELKELAVGTTSAELKPLTKVNDDGNSWLSATPLTKAQVF